ncbi:hypothetical protein E1B28_005828 [Marasmius oreades]|uniref:Autophagy-related protein 27 n=1 Tax=Marasmius oreades TaxID=181124 RepID=A0A9P7S498_9AGAR|nr:uncharacterized protein E1B28_005828 [Marasmius oreades]KAG7095037.1 hypothetical protein E1B28_005828 [Marasmius oreades]
MSPSTLLYLLIFPLSLHALTTHVPNSLCKFSLQRYVYDLCPLLQEPAFTVGDYRFNSQNDNGPTCTKNTWICLNDPQRSPITVASIHSPMISKPEMETHKLRIQYTGGTHNGTFHSALIYFICDTDTRLEHSSAPKPLVEHDGIHSFHWATKHACPIALADDLTDSGYIYIAEDLESQPDQGEQEEGGENFIDPTVKPRLSARATALTISIIGMLLLSTCYFIYNPPTQLLNHYLRPSLSRLPLPDINSFCLTRFKPKKYRSGRRPRPHNFRVGENRLVQWAQEDMLEDDIDVMVNAHDDDDAILDEYVPLSVGMDWQTRRPRDYGSTQFP